MATRMRFHRMSIRSLMLAVAALGLVLGCIRLCHYLYYMDLISTTNTLASIHGITDVHVYGFDDMAYEVTFATFALQGRPDAVIECLGVNEPGHVWLRRLGPWEFHECNYGIQNAFDIAGKPIEGLSVQSFVDIGPSGKYAAMLPVKIRDLNDVVSHYDELVRYFSTWPNEKTWAELKRRPGMRTAYFASPAGRGSIACALDLSGQLIPRRELVRTG